MNMMSLQERREERAVPDFVRDLSSEFDDGAELAPAQAAPPPSVRVTLLERLGWFRDLSLANKINTIFGTFFAVGLAMVLVLGLGLTELWNRYQSSARVQEAVIASTELHGAAGELRYYSMRTLYEGTTAARDQRSQSQTAVLAHIAAIEPVVTAQVPDMKQRITTLRSDVTNFQADFEGADDAARSGAPTGTGKDAIAAQGDQLVEASARFAADLAAHSETLETTGIAYFFNMILIIASLALVGGVVLLLGLAYLSRDFSRKITDITSAMTQLAEGDRNFAIDGQERQDEIGAMVRALDLFKRASKRLEIWARERSEKVEQELQLQQERERERIEAEARKAALLDEVARKFERTVGEVVGGVAAASSQLHSTATRMAASAEEASRRAYEEQRRVTQLH